MIGLLLAAAAGAAEPDQAEAKKAKDNNPVICQTQGETGSLLRKKRVCMLKSEWEAQRQQNRQQVDKTQMMPMKGE